MKLYVQYEIIQLRFNNLSLNSQGKQLRVARLKIEY